MSCPEGYLVSVNEEVIWKIEEWFEIMVWKGHCTGRLCKQIAYYIMSSFYSDQGWLLAHMCQLDLFLKFDFVVEQNWIIFCPFDLIMFWYLTLWLEGIQSFFTEVIALGCIGVVLLHALNDTVLHTVIMLQNKLLCSGKKFRCLIVWVNFYTRLVENVYIMITSIN